MAVSAALISPTPKTEYPFACQPARRRSMAARLTPSSFQNRIEPFARTGLFLETTLVPDSKAAQLGKFLRVCLRAAEAIGYGHSAA